MFISISTFLLKDDSKNIVMQYFTVSCLTEINHGFTTNKTKKTLNNNVIQIVLDVLKTWILHFYYDKTMVHFYKG